MIQLLILCSTLLCALMMPMHSIAQIPTEKVTSTNDPLVQAVPQAAVNTTTAPEHELIKEDPLFDPYDEKDDPESGEDPSLVNAKNPVDTNSRQRQVEVFDFDPSEGLTFHVFAGKRECFYQDAKYEGDEISGAYIVSSADSHIDMEIKNPHGQVVYRRFGDAEGQYYTRPTDSGLFEICFINSDSEGKLVTHVTNLLKSQHPVEREHVSVLAKYASHLDVRLGELESEQRLHTIRTDRFLKIEQSTSERVAFYGTLECFVYMFIGIFQVYYIKSLLDGPREVLKKWVS